MKLAVLTSLIASTVAFAPPQSTRNQQRNALRAKNVLDDMAGSVAPIKSFDPLGLATLGSESTLAWFRAAELKHSRVAMVAFTGFCVNAAGIHFPGMLSHDVSFESLASLKPLDAWNAVPEGGRMQIYATILFAELVSEAKGVHYTKGGPMPTIVFPPVDFSARAPDKTMQTKELQNGRLAMIGIMSFIAEANFHGSVPALDGLSFF